MRLALPKGRPLEGVLAALRNVGLTFTGTDDRDYSPDANVPWIAAKIIKVRAIPQMLALGRFQAGFCGLDLIAENGDEDVVPLLDLGLDPVRLVVAAPQGHEDILLRPPKRPLLIASEYERIASAWALRRGLAHVVLQTWGSTEAFAPDDADIVFDNVSSGATLRSNGLVIIDEIMASSTHLVTSRGALQDRVMRHQIDLLHGMLKACKEEKR